MSETEMDENLAIAALVLGSLCFLAVLFNFVFRGRFEFKDIAILLFGFLLVGLPVFQTIDFTISGASIQGKFEQSIGVAKADTNAELEKLKKDVATLNEKIGAIVKQDPSTAKEVVQIDNDNKPSADFVANGQFTVLVFYRETQTAKAKKIVSELLQEGYKASGIVTDLGEAKQNHDPGTAWIVWEANAKAVAQKLSAVVARISPDSMIKIREDAYDLNRGDAQILLF